MGVTSTVMAISRTQPATLPIARSPFLPPHLREVCDILALGMLRMRATRLAHAATQTPGVDGESSLHFQPRQSGHATPQLGRPR
jgi:hypothetical protein